MKSIAGVGLSAAVRLIAAVRLVAAVVAIALALAVPFSALTMPALADELVEPRTGARFPTRSGEMSLLGVGLRVKTIAFIRVKVYAIGLYVSDAALGGLLAPLGGATGTPAFYKDLVWGDFAKQVTLRFVRDVGQGRIQEAMREALSGADKSRVEAFVSYFPEVKTGQEAVLRWAPGGVLETTMAGQAKPPIADKAFTAAVFAIWLGEKPIQEDIKKDLVSRGGELLKP